jgi:acetyl esterase/lipase
VYNQQWCHVTSAERGKIEMSATKFAIKYAVIAATLGTMLSATPIQSQDRAPAMPMGKRIEAPAQPNAISLYAGAAPGSEGAKQNEVWTKMFGEKWIRNVTHPTITPFLPKKGKATGAAVLVIPGGGYKFVSISNEGWPIAKWLADRGVAAFVLKYRVDETPDSETEFGKQMAVIFSEPPSKDGPSSESQKSIDLARSDAQAALRMIRNNSGKWSVDVKRVGLLGFSAGAMTTMATALADAPDARPDFIAPIYGFMTPVTPPSKPQPMFVALASDDALFGKQGFGLVESWAKAGGSTELHFYEGGGHGFGSHKKNTTSDLWFDQYMAWMQVKGFLTSKQKAK